MSSIARVPFRFDVATHTYTELGTGRILPHITGMLTRTGWIDDLWMTEESSVRGHQVHALTAEYDLGALDPAAVETPHRGYLLAHVAAMRLLGLEVLAVEEPIVHPTLLFGGRPDRLVADRGVRGPLEIKTAAPAKSHPIQVALQAILAEPVLELPAELQRRLCLYLQPSGKFRVEEYRDRSDFRTARQIIKTTCF